MLKRFASSLKRCQFSTVNILRSGKQLLTIATPQKSNIEYSEKIPGFREPGAVATDYEVATGLERFELLKTLKGEDPWEDLHPIEITALGTTKNPIEIKGIDSERYIGCTGNNYVYY